MMPHLHHPANSAQIQPRRSWLWCSWGMRPGGPDKFGPLVAIWLWLSPPQLSIFFVQFSRPQKGAALPSPSQFSPNPATSWLIVVSLNILTGGTVKFGPLDAIWLWLTHPPNVKFSSNIYGHKTESPFHPLADSAKAQPPVGWLWYVWIIQLGGTIEIGPLDAILLSLYWGDELLIFGVLSLRNGR